MQIPLRNKANHYTLRGIEMSKEAIHFMLTREYRRFVEFCDDCRKNKYIGLCYGTPGVGKTISARKYSNWDVLEDYFESVGSNNYPSADFISNKAAFYTAPVAATPGRIERETKQLLNRFNLLVEDILDLQQGKKGHQLKYYHNMSKHAELLIVDESDRLKMTGLEQLRDTFDRDNMGLILIGMPGIEKRLARFPQLYSRIGFVHSFEQLSKEEAQYILKEHWMDIGFEQQPNFWDDDAMAEILRVTGGNFRLLMRLCSQIQRIMDINEVHILTVEVVEAARQSIIVGA